MKNNYLDYNAHLDRDVLRWRLRLAKKDLDRAIESAELRHAETLAEEIEAYEEALRQKSEQQRGPGALVLTLLALLLCLPTAAQAQEREPLPTGPVQLVATAYCPCEKCCGRKSRAEDVGRTASGKMAVAGRTLAAPRDLPFGTEIVVLEGDGETGRLGKGVRLGVVEDRGGAIRWRKGSKTGQRVLHVDVFFDSHKAAREWGIKTAVVQIVLPQATKEEDR